VKDIGPLRYLYNLCQLDISRANISSLKPLGHLQNLHAINLSNKNDLYSGETCYLANCQFLIGNVHNKEMLHQVLLLLKAPEALVFADVTTLEPFKPIPTLRFLRLHNLNTQKSLSELQPLSALTHLSALHINSEGMPINFTIIRNLNQLHTLELEQMQLFGLEGLEHLTSLQRLILGIFINVPDISPCQFMHDLQSIHLMGVFPRQKNSNRQLIKQHPGLDLSPLFGLPNLKSLHLFNLPLKNMEQLQHLHNLRELSLTDISIDELHSLQSLSKLEMLDISGTTVDDLTPLRALKRLKVLNIVYTRVRNIDVLLELPPLTSLIIEQHRLNKSEWAREIQQRHHTVLFEFRNKR